MEGIADKENQEEGKGSKCLLDLEKNEDFNNLDNCLRIGLDVNLLNLIKEARKSIKEWKIIMFVFQK